MESTCALTLDVFTYSKIISDEIRQDVEDVMFRMKPWKHEFNDAEVVWGGWARMALPISGCRIVHVGKPLVGEVLKN